MSMLLEPNFSRLFSYFLYLGLNLEVKDPKVSRKFPALHAAGASLTNPYPPRIPVISAPSEITISFTTDLDLVDDTAIEPSRTLEKEIRELLNSNPGENHEASSPDIKFSVRAVPVSLDGRPQARVHISFKETDIKSVQDFIEHRALAVAQQVAYAEFIYEYPQALSEAETKKETQQITALKSYLQAKIEAYLAADEKNPLKNGFAIPHVSLDIDDLRSGKSRSGPDVFSLLQITATPEGFDKPANKYILNHRTTFMANLGVFLTSLMQNLNPACPAPLVTNDKIVFFQPDNLNECLQSILQWDYSFVSARPVLVQEFKTAIGYFAPPETLPITSASELSTASWQLTRFLRNLAKNKNTNLTTEQLHSIRARVSKVDQPENSRLGSYYKISLHYPPSAQTCINELTLFLQYHAPNCLPLGIISPENKQKNITSIYLQGDETEVAEYITRLIAHLDFKGHLASLLINDAAAINPESLKHDPSGQELIAQRNFIEHLMTSICIKNDLNLIPTTEIFEGTIDAHDGNKCYFPRVTLQIQNTQSATGIANEIEHLWPILQEVVGCDSSMHIVINATTIELVFNGMQTAITALMTEHQSLIESDTALTELARSLNLSPQSPAPLAVSPAASTPNPL